MSIQSQRAPLIDGNDIVYANHIVRLIGFDVNSQFAIEYIREMADDLDAERNAMQHAHDLEMMNNDGSWVVIENGAHRRRC